MQVNNLQEYHKIFLQIEYLHLFMYNKAVKYFMHKIYKSIDMENYIL